MDRRIRNFFKGAGSVLDLLPVKKLSLTSGVATKSVTEALGQDWKNVGNRIWSAMNRFSQELKRGKI